MPSLTLDGTNIDTYEFKLPEGYENIWEEITPEDVAAVRAMHADYDEEVQTSAAEYALSDQEMSQLIEDVDAWQQELANDPTEEKINAQ